jgi:D-tyrosyl-tRNA(Tyr) deacylase
LKAKELYDAFFSKVQELYHKEKVKDGIFQAMMDVSLVNDGPVGLDFTSEDGAVCHSYPSSQKQLMAIAF